MSREWYVYTLAYPDGKVFYVGKGSKSRIMCHEADARNSNRIRTYFTPRSEIIRQIWKDGGKVLKKKVAVFDTQEEAGQGGTRPGAGRPHEHQEYLFIEVVDFYGDKDVIIGGLLDTKGVLERAHHIAAHHVNEQARSVKIVKRLCCSLHESETVEVIKGSSTL